MKDGNLEGLTFGFHNCRDLSVMDGMCHLAYRLDEKYEESDHPRRWDGFELDDLEAPVPMDDY